MSRKNSLNPYSESPGVYEKSENLNRNFVILVLPYVHFDLMCTGKFWEISILVLPYVHFDLMCTGKFWGISILVVPYVQL